MQACQGCLEADPATTENRIIMITDAQPNQGDTSDEGLLARLKALAADGIHTTIVGALPQSLVAAVLVYRASWSFLAGGAAHGNAACSGHSFSMAFEVL